MRCNIFKPINGGDDRMGTFLMFSQYTEDITKEQAQKSTYRVVPSKFVALNLNFNNFFEIPNPQATPPIPPKPTSTQMSFNPTTNEYEINVGDETVSNSNTIIPQVFQSYYENAMAFMRNNISDPNSYNSMIQSITGDNLHPLPSEWDINDTLPDQTGYAAQMLWRTLEDWGLVHKITAGSGDDTFPCYDEVKYVGDINIHSNHTVGAYSYDEIFCHIPANDDEYYYHIRQEDIENLFVESASITPPLNLPLEDWTDVMYPYNIPTKNRVIAYHEANTNYLYRYGGDTLNLDYDEQGQEPVARHTSDDTDVEYNFNTIIIFYDVLNNEPGSTPQYIHKGRPMGIYFSGPTNLEFTTDEDSSTNVSVSLKNTFTKYVTNNDAFGQGASFGLRLMMRYTPTPNMSTYIMAVDASGNDYETITQAMGGIADAIVDMNRLYRERYDMFQSYKNHLAQFRNNRANVPYVRLANGKYYWFVNGRNTNMPVYQEGPSGQIYEIVADLTDIINPTTNKIYLVGPITGSTPDSYEEYIWDTTLGWTRIGITSYEAIDDWTIYEP